MYRALPISDDFFFANGELREIAHGSRSTSILSHIGNRAEVRYRFGTFELSYPIIFSGNFIGYE
jgi:hypothetical protein